MRMSRSRPRSKTSSMRVDSEWFDRNAAGQAEMRRTVARGRRIAGQECLMIETKVGRSGHEGLRRNADVLGHPVGPQTAQPAGDHAEIGMFGPSGRGRIG